MLCIHLKKNYCHPHVGDITKWMQTSIISSGPSPLTSQYWEEVVEVITLVAPVSSHSETQSMTIGLGGTWRLWLLRELYWASLLESDYNVLEKKLTLPLLSFGSV